MGKLSDQKVNGLAKSRGTNVSVAAAAKFNFANFPGSTRTTADEHHILAPLTRTITRHGQHHEMDMRNFSSWGMFKCGFQKGYFAITLC